MYYGFQGLLANPWMLIFFIIMVVRNLQAYLYGEGSILSLVSSIPALLIAITFHEFAHAFAADKLGDDTPRSQGRLTLNPLAHLDPIGLVLLLFCRFGWGRPVEINPRNFVRTMPMKRGSAIVAAAGPVMNFLLAIAFTIITKVLTNFSINIYVLEALVLCIIYNISLGVFNLIPLPPLDGSKILVTFLPDKARVWYQSHEMMLYIIFIVLWMTSIMSYIISPVVEWLYSLLISFIII